VGPHPAVAATRVAVRDVLRSMSPGDLVLVACSGGADSLALAAATAFEASRAGIRAGAITIDHGLQPGSTGRAVDLVGRLRAMDLDPVEALGVRVGRRGGPEAAARTARYEALDIAAARHGARAVFLGHTLDDQAETVLLGLARGSGARSLAGMPAVIGHYRRPLLGIDRDTTRAACVALDLATWDDPHNADPAYTRARVRHDVLPVLEKALGPGISESLARTARLFRDDADALDAWADRVQAELTLEDGGLDVGALAELPAAVRRRVLRRKAISVGSPPGPINLPGGVEIRRRCGKLLFHRPSQL
jgi:tRNA(Ile)-lysidine synthase